MAKDDPPKAPSHGSTDHFMLTFLVVFVCLLSLAAAAKAITSDTQSKKFICTYSYRYMEVLHTLAERHNRLLPASFRGWSLDATANAEQWLVHNCPKGVDQPPEEEKSPKHSLEDLLNSMSID